MHIHKLNEVLGVEKPSVRPERANFGGICPPSSLSLSSTSLSAGGGGGRICSCTIFFALRLRLSFGNLGVVVSDSAPDVSGLDVYCPELVSARAFK